MFGSRAEKAMAYHKLATRNYDELLEFNSSISKSEIKNKMDQNRRKLYFMPLVSEHLNLDPETIQFLSALVRVSLGDSEGFEYIANEYELSITSTMMCKAICSISFDNMKVLFQALHHEINMKHSHAIAQIFDGDI